MSSPSRRKMHWDKIASSPRAWLAVAGGTFFGAGLLPRAPGTWGTLAALPLWFGIQNQSTPIRAGVWLFLALWGWWSARELDALNDTRDNQNVVMDEVTGVGIAAWCAGPHLLNFACAFILFRAFDIWKPYPVRLVDRWSHRPGRPALAAFGVMADDWVAGLQAWLVLTALQFGGVLPS